jgi:hypothetical protein
VALDVQPVDADALQFTGRRIAIAAQREDLDGPAGADQALRLTPDTRILLVVGVREHGDGSRGGTAHVAMLVEASPVIT